MSSVGCYTIGETIGQGTYGKVKKGYHKFTGKSVAIKKISKQHAPMMAREIHHHKQIKHPNVVMLYEMITTESAIHIISEYCPRGDLLDALTESGGRCSEERVHTWFLQLSDAINFCHLQHIVHRDLKLENILLDADDNVKICDFGFARFTQKNQFLDTFCGSLSYSAPEILLRKKYTGPETDIWSLGVILYTLLAGVYPFDEDSDVITQRKITQGDYEMPYYFSSKLSSLIHNMIQVEPTNRLSMHAILHHPWVIETEYNALDEGLTPSSSTSSNNSAFSDIDVIHSPQSKFSPQVKETLASADKSPRFSAPSLNNTRRLSGPRLASNRTSLPSSFAQKGKGMTEKEHTLFTALSAAGFDQDALVKMQSGSCDTSSTLWHLLLENMVSPPSESLHSVSDAFASAMGKNECKKIIAVDCAVQTSPVQSRRNSFVDLKLDAEVKPYPKPPPVQHPTIQTVGFGSTQQENDGWFSSVKSWFGSKQVAPALTNSSPIHVKEDNLVMSQPIYRTGSQKYRRKLLQLSEPPVCELDQLTYNNTSFTGTASRKNSVASRKNSITSRRDSIASRKNSITSVNTRDSIAPVASSVIMPPTALTSTRDVADTFSILVDAKESQEVDICEKRYSMLQLQQPTPPPSPPAETRKSVEHVSPAIAPIQEKPLSLLPEKKIEPFSMKVHTKNSIKDNFSSSRSRSSRFETNPRSRLSAYSIQESRIPPMSSKTIIEEEEEE